MGTDCVASFKTNKQSKQRERY